MLWRNGGTKSVPAGVSMICEVVITTYSTFTLGVIAQYCNCLSDIFYRYVLMIGSYHFFERKARG
jgi:hypothetical protein